jgi:type II secretory pathway component PulF
MNRFRNPSIDQPENSVEERQDVTELRNRAVMNARAWAQPLAALSREMKSPWIAKTLARLATKLESTTSIEQLARDRSTAEVLTFVLKELDSDQTVNWLLRLTRQLEVRRQHRIQLLYPIVSMCLIGLVLIFGAVWIVPPHSELWAEFGLQLSGPQRILVSFSESIYPHSHRAIAVVALSIISISALVFGLKRFVGLQLRVPILIAGSSASLKSVGVVCQNAAELMQLEFSKTQALKLAAQGCGHGCYEVVVHRLCDELKSQGNPNTPISKCILPPLLLSAICSELSDPVTLSRIGQIYRDRAQIGASQSALVWSNLTIIAAGCIVGFIVVALYTPLIATLSTLT